MASNDDVAATKAWFQQQFGGDNRGQTLVMGAPTDVQPYGFNPQQMNMSEGRDVAEERLVRALHPGRRRRLWRGATSHQGRRHHGGDAQARLVERRAANGSHVCR
jgi:hypothetical protein